MSSNSLSGKINTALKYAEGEGVLVVNSLGVMKNINVESEAGYWRMQSFVSKTPEFVVGFYKVNRDFTQDEVRKFIMEDTKGLV